MAKKKLKDLTLEEMERICDNYSICEQDCIFYTVLCDELSTLSDFFERVDIDIEVEVEV